MPLDPASDEALFVQYRSEQDEDALRELIVRHKDDLYRMLFRLLGDRAAADDVFQETFLQIHLSSSSFDSSRRFRPWLFTIAANKGRDYLRRKGRRRASPLDASVGGGSDGSRTTSFVDLMEIDVPRPDAGMLAEDQSRLVQKALDSMPDTLREIILLAYFQRLTYAQIASELDIPLGTVKSRLHAAVASFARAWKRASGEDAGGKDGRPEGVSR